MLWVLILAPMMIALNANQPLLPFAPCPFVSAGRLVNVWCGLANTGELQASKSEIFPPSLTAIWTASWLLLIDIAAANRHRIQYRRNHHDHRHRLFHRLGIYIYLAANPDGLVIV